MGFVHPASGKACRWSVADFIRLNVHHATFNGFQGFCTTTDHPSWKLSKLDEPDMWDIDGEVKTNSKAMYSCGPPGIDKCTRARYGHVWNVYRMTIKIEHRNLETRKTLDVFFVQVRNFLLPLSLKVIQHKEREAQSFYFGFFICPPPTRVTPAIKVSASKRKLTVFPRGRSHLNSLTFSKSPQILHALPVRDVIRTR